MNIPDADSDPLMHALREKNKEAARTLSSTLLSVIVARNTNHQTQEIDFAKCEEDIPEEFERLKQALQADAVTSLKACREELSALLKGGKQKWMSKSKLK